MYLAVESPQTATFESLNATLIYIKRSDNRQQYIFNADAFSNFKSIWLDKKSYNHLLIEFEAIFDPDVPYPPSYINGQWLTAELFHLKSVEKVKATSIKQSKTDKLVNIQNLK